ncbi:hypothetical protein BJ165DRAFT_181467 [Panaeolus papilionaceus]|nr:hypothetical protein BJ165DRAFT_181467 [Panaeolus papilionaceus]
MTYPVTSSRPLSDAPTVSSSEIQPESCIHAVPEEPPVIIGHVLNDSHPIRRSSNSHSSRSGPVNHPTTPSPLPNHVHTVFNESEGYPFVIPKRTSTYVLGSIMVLIIRQAYLYALFRLPAFYFSHVAIFFEEADMSLGELKWAVFEQVLNCSSHKSDTYRRLSDSWAVLVDSLMKGCETLNVISALLLTAILTVLQLDSAATDPITRFSALASMICALLSLLFGCIYIIWLGTMKKLHKAAEIALETKKLRTSIVWNTWVMLAMPAIWLGWSILCYIICIMSFLWRTGAATDKDHEPPSDRSILAPCIALSVILALGLVVLALIIRTVTRYGTAMDQAWQRRIWGWVRERQGDNLYDGLDPYIQPYPSAKNQAVDL